MQLTTEEVLKIAHLARLSLSEKELEKFASQLSEFLEHAKMLEEVDTTGVEPIAQITGLQDVFFDDVVQSFPRTQELLRQSPQPVQENMIKVPKTL